MTRGALLPVELEARFTNPFQFAYKLTLLKTKTIHMLSISYTTRFNFRPNLHDGRYKLLVACMEYTMLGKPISKVSSSRLNGENAFAVINCFFFMSVLKFGR